MENRGEPAFHGRQLFHWLHGRSVHDYALMTDLSQELRQQLAKEAPLVLPEPVERRLGPDGTMKVRFRLADGCQVEGVYMPEEKRRTICVSTQAGCGMGCIFCATAGMGLVRSLTAGEITGQVEAIVPLLGEQPVGHPVSNVVFMGMGEPLANLEAVATAVDNLRDPLGLGLSRRHITVSTCGLVPAMEKFAGRVAARLAVSLNATSDEVRSRIMPINRRYGLDVLLECCRKLELPGTDRLTFEYVMMRGINDSVEDARRLPKLLSGIHCKINLIPFNQVAGLPFERPENDQVENFQSLLLAKNFSVFIRRSRGDEVQAACGQLVTERKKESDS